MMVQFMFSMQIQKDLILERHFKMLDFIYRALVFGRNSPLYLEEVHINGNMNQFFMVGRKKENTTGIQEGRSLPFGNLIKTKKNGDHPTMKPIPLVSYPIKNSSMTNSIVLDPFGGSGSTLIACE